MSARHRHIDQFRISVLLQLLLRIQVIIEVFINLRFLHPNTNTSCILRMVDRRFISVILEPCSARQQISIMSRS
jgi:hypothetical protein